MALINGVPIFPSLPGQAFGTIRRPVWRTSIQSCVSGVEQRVAYMSFPLYQWELNFGAIRSYLTNTDLSTLIGFFNQINGSAGMFYFQDPEDNSVPGSSPQSIGVGNGSNTQFQCVRSYGGFIEPVQSIYGSPQLYDNGSPVSGTINTAGVATFSSAPATGHTAAWSGTYYWLCRMLTDNFDVKQAFKNVWTNDKFSFQSIKQ